VTERFGWFGRFEWFRGFEWFNGFKSHRFARFEEIGAQGVRSRGSRSAGSTCWTGGTEPFELATNLLNLVNLEPCEPLNLVNPANLLNPSNLLNLSNPLNLSNLQEYP
jgi:hypothetical protein